MNATTIVRNEIRRRAAAAETDPEGHALFVLIHEKAVKWAVRGERGVRTRHRINSEAFFSNLEQTHPDLYTTYSSAADEWKQLEFLLFNYYMNLEES